MSARRRVHVIAIQSRVVNRPYYWVVLLPCLNCGRSVLSMNLASYFYQKDFWFCRVCASARYFLCQYAPAGAAWKPKWFELHMRVHLSNVNAYQGILSRTIHKLTAHWIKRTWHICSRAWYLSLLTCSARPASQKKRSPGEVSLCNVKVTTVSLLVQRPCSQVPEFW